MAIVHFLNVKEGDCNIIKHDSGNITVIDVCNARKALPPSGLTAGLSRGLFSKGGLYDLNIDAYNAYKHTPALGLAAGFSGLRSPNKPTTEGLLGNFRQKENPVNPIEYMKKYAYSNVFRFILTHPDMDHMDGLKDFFEEFSPTNFWDTANNRKISWNGSNNGGYREEDWLFYQQLRKQNQSPRTLRCYTGAENKFFNKDDNAGTGDGLYILAPDPDIVEEANKNEDYNNCSYVLLFVNQGRKIVFGGDSHDKTWERILHRSSPYRHDIENIDVLIAPHHGRDSDMDFSFLEVLNPKLTLFGNADSNHLAHDVWNDKDLFKITNNQAGCVILNITYNGIGVYVTNNSYAKGYQSCEYNQALNAFFIRYLQ